VRVIEVEWLDAHSGTHETSVKKANKNKPILTRTIGFLMAENEHGITLISDYWPDKEGRGFVEHFIGWGMVNQIWEYK